MSLAKDGQDGNGLQPVEYVEPTSSSSVVVLQKTFQKLIMVCYPCEISFHIFLLEQGWRSGDSTRLPPIWPVFVSWNLRRVWVVGTPVFTVPKGVFDTFWGGQHLSFTIGI